MWVGFIQSMEGLNRRSETAWVRENFTCLIEPGHWSSALGLDPEGTVAEAVR